MTDEKSTPATGSAAKKAAAARAARRKAEEQAPPEAPFEAPFQFIVITPSVALHYPVLPGAPVPDDDGEVLRQGDYVVPDTLRQYEHLRQLESLGLLRAMPLT